ncbi:MAG TPA: glycosyltransferase family 9 protein [Burkholderiaceae bacterium]|nr:glycosyltransferase family 9 protein [Burkholderiaceae bacterium]
MPDHLQRWHRARRVLAVRLDNLGDVLMTTPALAALRQALPQAELTLLASPYGAHLQPHLAMVDRVIPHRASWLKHDHPATAVEEAALMQRLAAESFDAAVIFTVCTQSALPAALMCRLAGIPLRLAHSRENPYSLLSDWVPDPDVDIAHARHEVRRQLDLVATVGFSTPDERLRFALPEVDRETVASRLRHAGLPPGANWIVVHPGATAASRRYPAERFGVAADAIGHDSGCTVIFTGDASEQPLVAEAMRAMRGPALSFAGMLTLGELAALIAGARLLVSNNSGPVHLAAALGTPVVDLYALTNPQHTPWKVPHRVLYQDVPCRNCLKSVCPEVHHRCLLDVTPQAVAQAALELLAEQDAHRRIVQVMEA